MWPAYSSDNHIYIYPRLILCAKGLNQGYPLGSLAFYLSIHPVITSINSDFNCWYLDDGTFGGNIESVSEDLQALQQNFSQIGPKVNPKNLEVTIFNTPTLSTHNHAVTRMSEVTPGIVEVSFISLTLL